MRLRALSALALLLAAAAAASGDSVDVQLRGKDKVAGSIRPVFATESFLCELTAGTKLAASVKSKTKNGPAVALALTLDDAPVEEAVFTPKGTGGVLKFTALDSGSYRVVVSGDGVKDGDYEIVVTWKPQTKWAVQGGPTAPEDVDFFEFSAPAGALATVEVVKAGGSKFAGNLIDVEDLDGNPIIDFSDEPRSRGVVLIPETGDYSVSFTNVGSEDGEWIGKVKLRLPKVKLGKFDLRDSALGGAFSDDNTIFGRVLGPDGGVIEFDSGAGEPLDGTTIEIPADTLGGPTIITIAATAQFNAGDGVHPAGPAIELGPPGTTFTTTDDQTKQAHVTIPFDPAYFPGGDTTNLVIYVKNADGSTTTIPGPYSFSGNTVSFFTSHFSAYQPGTTNVRPFTGNWIAVEPGRELSTNFEGEFGVDVHTVSSTATVEGTFADVFESYARVQWLDFGTQGAVADGIQTDQFQGYQIQTPDDATVVFDGGEGGETITFKRGVSDDVLVGRDSPILLLRRPNALPTVNAIAGQWHVFVLEFEGDTNFSEPSVVRLVFRGETGSATLAPDGKVTLGSFREMTTESNFPSGSWSPQVETKPGETGLRWTIGENDVRIQAPGDEEEAPLSLLPTLNGNVLIGRQTNFGGVRTLSEKQGTGNGTERRAGLYVFVRKSAGLPKSAFAGSFRFADLAIEPVDRASPESQGVQFKTGDVVVGVNSKGDVTLFGTEDVTTHDAQGQPTTSLDEPVSEATKITLKPDGSFTTSDDDFGALVIGGGLLIRAAFRTDGLEIGFGTRFVE
jgi:hypothetical protein